MRNVNDLVWTVTANTGTSYSLTMRNVNVLDDNGIVKYVLLFINYEECKLHNLLKFSL